MNQERPCQLSMNFNCRVPRAEIRMSGEQFRCSFHADHADAVSIRSSGFSLAPSMENSASCQGQCWKKFCSKSTKCLCETQFCSTGFHVPRTCSGKSHSGFAGWLKCCSIPSDGNAGDSQGRTVARVVRSLGVGHFACCRATDFLPLLRSRYEVKNIIGSGSYGSVCQIPQLVCLDFLKSSHGWWKGTKISFEIY